MSDTLIRMQSGPHNSPLPPLSLRGGIVTVDIQISPLGLRRGWGSSLNQHEFPINKILLNFFEKLHLTFFHNKESEGIA